MSSTFRPPSIPSIVRIVSCGHCLKMNRPSIQDFSLEVIAEMIRCLDYPDQENTYHSCRTFYRARRFVLYSAIDTQSSWLKSRENSSEIPREELISHNAFLTILNQTYDVIRPCPHELDRLVKIFVQEMISAWMVPTNPHGAELRCNNRCTTLGYIINDIPSSYDSQIFSDTTAPD